MDEDNDGRFPDDSLVEVRYPRDRQEQVGDRSEWPWLPGSVLEQCGLDEWFVRVEARELATLDDGSLAPARTADRELLYPCCFRDASEIRCVTDGYERWSLRRWRIAGCSGWPSLTGWLRSTSCPP